MLLLQFACNWTTAYMQQYILGPKGRADASYGACARAHSPGCDTRAVGTNDSGAEVLFLCVLKF